MRGSETAICLRRFNERLFLSVNSVSSVAKMRIMRPCFSAELQRLGPEAHRRSFSAAEARSYCRRLARDHYENFTVASVFLPRPLIRHCHAVYAYCRWADD